MSTIRCKRVYEMPSSDDGTRVLVDRLWPRGLAKTDAYIDLWLKRVAPSAELRGWYDHRKDRWDEFVQRYHAELDKNPEPVATLREHCAAGTVTLLYATKAVGRSNADALKLYLSKGK